MILTCPNCATRYQADEAKFPPEGRVVRCAKCGQTWHQPGPVPEAAPPPEPGAEPGQKQPGEKEVRRAEPARPFDQPAVDSPIKLDPPPAMDF